jgi:regulator of replication initiation timing
MSDPQEVFEALVKAEAELMRTKGELEAVKRAARNYLERSTGYKYNALERSMLRRLVADDEWVDPHDDGGAA